MFMEGIQQHSSLKVINQKFLVPAHLHLECDSDHARIERAEKKMDVEVRISHDWYLFVKTVRGKKPFNVYEMKVNDFLSFSSLLQSLLVRRHVDNKNEKVTWLNIRWLQYTTDFGISNFKYPLFEEEPFCQLDL
ncbi:hypothetical protein PR048_011007 [Dryococelus australis]|uniref:Uncharacterized protein n=1 Tax=Dryococelus australis TaxID=614101 RepID=A0ABQ9HL26_9NEOP|nr:hypothetical protein PR048_011007 [Dryococelus australis]